MKAKLFTLGLTLAGAVGAFSLAHADIQSRLRTPWTDAVDGRLVDVQIRVDGRIQPLYMAPGRYDRHYFEALKGRNYSLVLRNNSGERIGVLIAVDGLNVVNGSRSRLQGGEPMYVLDPWESATINGWRTSLAQVRRFVFVDEERSYAERTGQSNSDMGWIRVLAFREQRPAWRWKDVPDVNDGRDDWMGSNERRPQPLSGEEAPRVEKSAPAPAAPTPDGARAQEAPKSNTWGESKSLYRGEAPQAESNPGTGWGDRRYDPVQRTQFVAERQATDHLILRYEYQSGLRALGIFPRNGNRLWEREGSLGFAQPPRW